MDNITLENNELMVATLKNQKEQSPEKHLKELGSNFNDETNDVESTEKSKVNIIV